MTIARLHSHTFTLRSAAPRLLAFTVWCGFAVWALHVFAPSSPHVDYNSDSAITVLMATDKTPVTLFNAYYYGQDRFGAWPFLVAQLIGRLTGFHWTAESVSLVHGAWAIAGSLVAAALSRKNGALIAISYLIALCVHGEVRYMLFRISQPYGWQMTTLLLAWLGFRGWFDGFIATEAEPARKRLAWLSFAFFCSFMAVWTATSSAPFLVVLAAVEVLRAHWKRPPGRTWRRVLGPGLLALGAVAGGSSAELVLRRAFNHHALRHYGGANSTNVGLDHGYLAINLAKAWHNIVKLAWWPLYFIPALAIGGFVAALVYARARQRTELEERLRALLADDTTSLFLGCYLVALVNFALIVVVFHVRFNGYDDRYLAPTNLLAPIAGLLSVFLFAKLIVQRPPALRRAELAFVGALTLVLAVAFPARGSEHHYQEEKSTALALAQKAPDAFLLGMYWDTYGFSALEPEHALTPVPFERQVNRMPWTVAWLRAADSAIVAFRRNTEQAGTPPLTLREYGISFVLSNPRFYEDSEHVFARYRTVRAETTILRRTYGPSDFELSSCARFGADNVIEADNCPDGIVVYGPHVTVPAESDVEFSFELEAKQPLRFGSELTSDMGNTIHGFVPEQPVAAGTRHWSGQSVHVFTRGEKLEGRIRVRAESRVSFTIHDLALSVR